MKLNKKTECSLFQVHVPIWSEKAVGLADYRLSTHNEVQILAKRKDGELYYPDKYYISRDKARTFPTKQRGGLDLRIVPINALEILERTDETIL